ncbi:MAG: acyl-CoA thioesterase [Gammaproteobacteria bacterium]|nr:acyl-CoA thioesterase [Gammaproteobacteria bacterium]
MNDDQMLDKDPEPAGELTLQTLAMPRDTNANGDIFGGWLVSQMDLAAGIAMKRVAKGRSATVAIKSVNFLFPVNVGSTVSCFAEVEEIGRSSAHINIEVWIFNAGGDDSLRKVAEGQFVFVAIDEKGRTRPIPR